MTKALAHTKVTPSTQLTAEAAADLWLSLKLEPLPPEQKEALWQGLLDTVQQRWLRRLAQRIAETAGETWHTQAGTTQASKLAFLHTCVPDSFELLLEEAEVLKAELSAIAAE